MVFYIDKDYKCHTEPAEGLTQVEHFFFDNKCKEWIEGYRFLPEGALWTDEHGNVWEGGQIFPWKDTDELDVAQCAYEREQARAARILLGEEE